MAKVAVCSLGCTRKRNEIHSWDTLAQLEGDYNLYINWETQTVDERQINLDKEFLRLTYDNLRHLSVFSEENINLTNKAAIDEENIYIDRWTWHTFEGSCWKSLPRFDQDQARLASIVTARNMCIEFAMQTDADHLLFIDADIIPPLDIIPKMLEVMAAGEEAVCGLVNGRGIHKDCYYVFGSKGFETIAGAHCQRVEHANIGFTMLSRRLFNQVRFRYGHTEYPDGRPIKLVSDDPCYHLDAFMKFGKWPVIRMDVVGTHVGDLQQNDTSQY